MLGGDPDVPWTCCVKIASFNICCALQVNALKQLPNSGNAIVIKVSQISTSSSPHTPASDGWTGHHLHSLICLLEIFFEGLNIPDNCHNSYTISSDLGVSRY